MKNLRVTIRAMMLVVMTMISSAGMVMAAEANAAGNARALAVKERVLELKTMDFKHMSATEKQAVRSEVKELKKEIRAMHPNTYVYIGGGTLLIVLILVLLLL